MAAWESGCMQMQAMQDTFYWKWMHANAMAAWESGCNANSRGIQAAAWQEKVKSDSAEDSTAGVAAFSN
ncbi:hypothetical protein V6N13_132841 [Hibiscus sabdariffa]